MIQRVDVAPKGGAKFAPRSRTTGWMDYRGRSVRRGAFLVLSKDLHGLVNSDVIPPCATRPIRNSFLLDSTRLVRLGEALLMDGLWQ